MSQSADLDASGAGTSFFSAEDRGPLMSPVDLSIEETKQADFVPEVEPEQVTSSLKEETKV